MKSLVSILYCLLFLSISSVADESSQDKKSKFLQAALAQTHQGIIYNPAYFKIGYPNGDIPAHFGVCTDVVIRAYRKINIDLQQLVHEDIQQNFNAYPAKKTWGQLRPDTNIDHRRVPNLQTFFTRKGKKLSVSNNSNDYQPGDLVTWLLGNKTPHIGVVTNRKSSDGERYLIVHNIGAGPQIEDVLFSYPISGHYRYGF